MASREMVFKTLNQARGVEVDGIIKWFNADRGYGFIEPGDGSDDVFFDSAALDPEFGGTGPEPDQSVTFEIVDGPRGAQAARVGRLIGPGGGFGG